MSNDNTQNLFVDDHVNSHDCGSLANISNRQNNFGCALDLYNAFSDGTAFSLDHSDESWLVKSIQTRDEDLTSGAVAEAGSGIAQGTMPPPSVRISYPKNGMSPRHSTVSPKNRRFNGKHDTQSRHREIYTPPPTPSVDGEGNSSFLLSHRPKPPTMTHHLLDDIFRKPRDDFSVAHTISGVDCWLVIVSVKLPSPTDRSVSEQLRTILEARRVGCAKTATLCMLIKNDYRVYLIGDGEITGLSPGVGRLTNGAVFSCTLVKTTLILAKEVELVERVPLIRLVINEHCVTRGIIAPLRARLETCALFARHVSWHSGPLICVQRFRDLSVVMDEHVAGWFSESLRNGLVSSRSPPSSPKSRAIHEEIVIVDSVVVRGAGVGRLDHARPTFTSATINLASDRDFPLLRLAVTRADTCTPICTVSHGAPPSPGQCRAPTVVVLDGNGRLFLSVSRFSWCKSSGPTARQPVAHMCLPFGPFEDWLPWSAAQPMSMDQIAHRVHEAMSFASSTMFNKQNVNPPTTTTAVSFDPDLQLHEQDVVTLANLLPCAPQHYEIAGEKCKDSSGVFCFSLQWMGRLDTTVAECDARGLVSLPYSTASNRSAMNDDKPREEGDIFIIRPKSHLHNASPGSVSIDNVVRIVAGSFARDAPVEAAARGIKLSHSATLQHLTKCFKDEAEACIQSTRFMSHL